MKDLVNFEHFSIINEAMRKEFPKAKIHVEDGTGAVVWT